MNRRPAIATRRTALRRAWLLALAATAGPAVADEPNPYYLGASQTFTYLNNLYNLADDQKGLLPSRYSANDTLSSTTLLAGVDQTWGRQRLFGSGTYSGNRYLDNTQLNNDSYAADLALNWATIERLSGTVRLNATQNLALFDVNTSGIAVTQKNVQNVAQADASIQVGLVTKFSAEATIGYRNVRYTAPEYDYLEYDQTSASAGLNYRPSGLLTLGTAYRVNHIEYPLFYVDAPDPVDREDRQYLDFTANYQDSQVSQFYLRVSPTRITYQQYTQRDESMVTGALSWHWQPSGKVKLVTTLSRDAGQSSAYDSHLNQGGNSMGDFSSTTSALQFYADYEMSGKVSFSGSIVYAHRVLLNTTSYTEGTPVTTTGNDNTIYLTLGARWTPTRNTLVGCNLLATDRRSDNRSLSVPYTSSSFGCFGQITLQ
jgi:hypothetical protein